GANRDRPGHHPTTMMRRTTCLLLLLSLAATGAAPLTGERLLCPMPMPMSSDRGSATGMTCDACATNAPTTAASLEAASCCTMAPAAVAEAVPATVTAQRRGGASPQDDASAIGAPVLQDAVPICAAPSFDTPAPSPASSPPPLSTQT